MAKDKRPAKYEEPPELTPEDEKILDKVWADLAAGKLTDDLEDLDDSDLP